MSTTTFHGPPGPVTTGQQRAAHQRHLPPDAEVAGFRGLVYALLLALPLWLLVALLVALA